MRKASFRLTSRATAAIATRTLHLGAPDPNVGKHIKHAFAGGRRGDPDQRPLGVEPAIEVEHETVRRQQERQAAREAGRSGARVMSKATVKSQITGRSKLTRRSRRQCGCRRLGARSDQPHEALNGGVVLDDAREVEHVALVGASRRGARP